jgi:hypothetical protein
MAMPALCTSASSRAPVAARTAAAAAQIDVADVHALSHGRLVQRRLQRALAAEVAHGREHAPAAPRELHRREAAEARRGAGDED